MEGSFRFWPVLRRSLVLWFRALRAIFLVTTLAALLEVPPIVLFYFAEIDDVEKEYSVYEPFIPFALFGLSFLIQRTVGAFFIGMVLKSLVMVDRGETWTFHAACYGALAGFPSLFVVWLLYFASVWVGLLCLIVPGIIFALQFYIAPVQVFCTDLNIIECLRESRALSSKRLGAVAAQFTVQLVLLLGVNVLEGFIFYWWSRHATSPWVAIASITLAFYIGNFFGAVTLSNMVTVNSAIRHVGVLEVRRQDLGSEAD